MNKETHLICFRGACKHAADVRGYNAVTHGMYCISCARHIDLVNKDAKLFPLLNAEITPGGSYRAGLILIREQ